MTGKCQHCGKEIESLDEIQQSYTRHKATIDENGVMDYELDDTYSCCDCHDWGVAHCPECGEEITGITSEEGAIAFLKGKGNEVV